MSDDVLCACGQPLHYRNEHTRAMVEQLIASAGGDLFVTVHVDGRVFRVQRHYIALHGIRADDLLAGVVPGMTEITP